MFKNQNLLKTILGFLAGIVAFVLILVAWAYSEVHTALYTLGGFLIILLGILAWLNQKTLKEGMKTRSVRYGANAALTIGLVLAILIVINFLNYNHYYRRDLTRDKIHSLSEQTIKILKELKTDVKFTAFVKAQAKDQIKTTFENYAYYAKGHLKTEYIDPDRDPARAKAANIKKYGTVIIEMGKKETRVEEASEEKLTTGLIKVIKDKNTQVCFLTGHGEKNADATDTEGYSQIKQELTDQSYEVKNVNLMEEAKVPESCTVLLVLGPNKAFFEKEITLLKAWLEAGGHALFALDPNLKGTVDNHSEMTTLLADWFIQVNHNLILDPTSRLLGVNASVPLIAIYNKENPIARDFQVATLFPLPSSIDLKQNPPISLKTWWLAKSTPKAFAKNNFKEIATGQVRLDEKHDLKGPHSVMVAVEGSHGIAKNTQKNESEKKTRIVALGTSQLAMNAYARHGANSDLFLNAVSWLTEDENLISIRPKEEKNQMPTLSDVEAKYIELFTKYLTPMTIMILGIGVWFRRRSL